MYGETKPLKAQSETESLCFQFVEECYSRFSTSDFADISRIVKDYSLGKLNALYQDIQQSKSSIEECIKRVESV